MRIKAVLVACSLVSLLSVNFAQASEKKVLVILEDLQVKSTHSILFGHLRQLGYQLEYKAADDKKLQIRDWDSWLYDKIICFAAAVPGIFHFPMFRVILHLTIAAHRHLVVFSLAIICQ